MREIGKSKIEYPDTYIVVDVETTGLSPGGCDCIKTTLRF